MNEAREWIREARAVAVLTGAGISAESGVPTFRGPGGLWRQYRPEQLATPEAFARDPLLIWEWHDWRRGKLARGAAECGPPGLGRAGEDETAVHAGDAERGRSPRPRGQPQRDQDPRRPVDAALHCLLARAAQAAREADLLLVVGTSAVVYPAAGLVPLAKACGARVIECNMEETPFSAELDKSFRGAAGELLPQLIES